MKFFIKKSTVLSSGGRPHWLVLCWDGDIMEILSEQSMYEDARLELTTWQTMGWDQQDNPPMSEWQPGGEMWRGFLGDTVIDPPKD